MIEKDRKYIFELMLDEISQKDIFDYFHANKRLLDEFQHGGFTLGNPKNNPKRIQVITNNLNKKRINELFMMWYDDKNNYEEILKPYFHSEKYREKEKKESSKGYYIFDDKVFKLIIKELCTNKAHLLYFLYFSPINFTEAQKSEIRKMYYKLNQNQDINTEKSASKNLIQVNEEHHEQKEKLKKDNSKLKIRMSQLEENLKHEIEKFKSIKKRIRELENSNSDLKIENEKISELESKLPEYEQLIKTLKFDLNELEHTLKVERKNGYNKYLDEKMKDIEKEIKIMAKKLSLEVIELEEQIKQLTVTKSDLMNLIEKKRNELEDYLLNGERWREAFRPKNVNHISINTELDTVFSRINIKEKMIQLKSRFLLSNEGILKQFKSNVFTLHGDSSDITAERFYKKKGYFRNYPHPYNFMEFLEIVTNYDRCGFALVIYNANRAPIECYFSNIISAINNDSSLIINNEYIKIPANIVFFFQIDDDEYSAKLSKRLEKIIKNNSNGDNNGSD